MGRKEEEILLTSAARTTEQIIPLPVGIDWADIYVDVTAVVATPILTLVVEQYIKAIDDWIEGVNATPFAPTGPDTQHFLFGQATNVAEHYDEHVNRLLLLNQSRLKIKVTDADSCTYSVNGIFGWI